MTAVVPVKTNDAAIDTKATTRVRVMIHQFSPALRAAIHVIHSSAVFRVQQQGHGEHQAGRGWRPGGQNATGSAPD